MCLYKRLSHEEIVMYTFVCEIQQCFNTARYPELANPESDIALKPLINLFVFKIHACQKSTAFAIKIHLQYFAIINLFIISREWTVEKTTCKRNTFLSLCAKRKCSISIKIHYVLVEVYFKSEKVLVSVHSWKIMGLGPFGPSSPLFVRNGQPLGLSPIRHYQYLLIKVSLQLIQTCVKLTNILHFTILNTDFSYSESIKIISRS